MARIVKGCSTTWLQPESAEEPKSNPSVMQQEEQADAAEGKVNADYKLDVDYKPEGSYPEIKPVNHSEEEEQTM